MSVQLNGFVVLYRKFREWEWYKNSNTKDVFIELLLTANFKDGKFEGHTVPRGSVVTSIPNLASAVGLTEMQVRTALKHLKLTGEITVKTTSKFSIITIKNYGYYQDDNRQNNSQLTVKYQSNTSQVTVNQQQRNNVTKKQGNKETIGSPYGEYETFEEMAREMRK